MKVYYLLLVSAFCGITPTHSQFFYSHYTPLPAPIFPQTFLPPPLTYTIPTHHTSSVTYNVPAIPTAEFRGFGYRTDFKDGASSTVFYVTGPEAQNLRSFKDFPSFTRKVQETSAGKARSLASDLLDINAIPDTHGKIQSILNPVEFDKLFDGATPGAINFYTFPAGTVPLALARSFGNNTGNATTPTTTTTTPSSNSDENEAAESVVNPKVVINAVENMIKSNGTTTEESSQENTTEAKVDETTENPSATEENPTTVSSSQETTTQA